jgi:hypothetical protein
MTEVNTDIYAPLMKPSNPMEQTNYFLDTASRVNQNRLQQQAIQSNSIGIDNAQVDLMMKRLGILKGTISSYLGDPGIGREDLTPKITRGVVDLVTQGILSPAHATEALTSIPSDPYRQEIHLRNLFSQTQDAIQKGQNFYGSVNAVPDQAGNRLVQAPGYPGLQVQDRGYVPDQIAPGKPTSQMDPTKPNYGAPGMTPPVAPPGIQQGPGSMPRGQPMQPPQQRVMRPAAQPAQAQQPPQQPQQPQQQPGQPILTGLPPDVVAARGASTQDYSAGIQSAGRYAQRVNPLRQAIPILEKMKETDIGPTSERWNEIKSAAQSLGAGTLLGIDPEKIRDRNELKKYFNQYSAQVSATMGGPKTNEGLASAVTSNPNVSMDRLSALELSKVAFGMERMQHTAVREFQNLVTKGQRQPGDYSKFMADFASEYDPRGFVYDLLDGNAQKKMVAGLSALQRARIGDSMMLAKKWGVLGDVRRGQ